MPLTIDLNADLGEECGDDAAMLSVVTSANLACGLHAGGPLVMGAVTKAATDARVELGAHPSYPDRANFGRVSMALGYADLLDVVAYQVAAFVAISGWPRFIKPHGALYHDVMQDQAVARGFVVAAHAEAPDTAFVGLAGSALEAQCAKSGYQFVAEAFADRAYLPDGSLAPRTMDGAVLHDPQIVAARAVRMVTEGVVEAIDGTLVSVAPQTLCVHGDTPGAVALASATRAALEAAGVSVRAWDWTGGKA